MANRLTLKRSSVAAKVPLATDLEPGELAVNLADQKLYSKRSDGTVILVGTGGAGAVTPAAISDQANTSTGYFQVPRGTTAQRPGSPATGMIRFNTDLNYLEEYRLGQWLAVSNVFVATGGTETTINVGGVDYKVHTFTSSGTFTVLSGTAQVEYLVVAGGGGGGLGGGGAGGYRCSVVGESSGGGASAEARITCHTGAYPVVIGAGGVGRANGTSLQGGDGTSSSAFGLSAIGGGGAGTGGTSGSFNAGRSGGSGGGAHNSAAPGSGTSGQGFAGGASSTTSNGSGGGGASAVGTGFGSGTIGGNGGAGVFSNITGTSTARGGGGGGYSAGVCGTGGLGGGGAGNNAAGNSGSANTGGGGGGGTTGGNGGSGVVIIRYAI